MLGKTKNSLKKVGVIVVCTSLMMSFSSCSLLPKEQAVMAPPLVNAPSVTYNTVAAKKGSIVNTLTGSGNFVAVSQQDMYFQQGGGNISKVYVKSGDSVKAGDVLAEIDTGDLAEQIKEQELSIQMTQLDLEQAQNANPVNTYDVQKAQLQVQMNQLKLDSLQAQLSKAKLTASISGKIVYAADLKIGQTVEAYQTLFSIANPNQLQVECTSDKIDFFKTGMKATVVYGSTNCTGTIVNGVENSPKSANSKEAKFVKVALDKIPDGAKIGDTVSVSIIIQQKDNVIVLDKSLVHSLFDARSYVNVLEKGAKVQRYVNVGISTDSSVEITKGVNEGDQIIKD